MSDGENANGGGNSSNPATPTPQSAISPEQLAKREIRVFISSTFRDMMRERDLLVKKVFPELRRKCAKRFITFTEVDLRWGITEEQAAEGQVLPLCLAEIERSRPYFIGLLGERYGWIPDAIRPDVLRREPWLQEHVQKRTSVTELEILHGVLNNPKMTGHAFFYFRDPAFASDPSLQDEERREMEERNIPADVEKHGEAVATRRAEERKAKLSALKQRIRDSKLPLVESYANPEALAEAVRRQFDELIDRLYPEDRTPDPLAQERTAHEAHAKNKLFGCIERPLHMKALTDFADRADTCGKGFVLTGESGGGKTALLAAWARDWTRENPDDFLFQHYFGATPESATPQGFLRRLLGELKQRFAIAQDVPVDPEKLRDALPAWLAMTPREVQIALVLDGVNQIQAEEPDRRLRFLPRHFPAHVTVLVSALPGPALEALHERGWVEHALPCATEAEADAMVAEYFRLVGRHVDAQGRPIQTTLRRQLVAAPGSRNPLFLRTVLEELRQFGRFEQLPDRVAHYLEARDPMELFLRVIRRWQQDFDNQGFEGRTRDLTLHALTHLWAARQGLSETEWLDLLGSNVSEAQNLKPETSSPLPRALWTPLLLALEPHLSHRDGLFAFGHDFLRQAVEAAWVSTPDLQCAAQLAVADYFERHPNQMDMTPRKAAEWPFHLHAAKSWQRLEVCLTDIPLFLALYNDRTKWELTGYWHCLRRMNYDMGACYTAAFRNWAPFSKATADHFVPAQLGQFLSDNGLFPAAEPLLREALEACERVLGPEHPSTLASVNNLALLLQSKGDYAGAQPLCERALETGERVLGPEDPSTLVSVINLGGLLKSKGDYAGAQRMYERALATGERVSGSEHSSTLVTANNLAQLLENKGDLVGAQRLYERALEACARVLGPEHPSTLVTLNNLAGLLERKGDYAGALPLVEQALEAGKRVLGPEHPSTLGSANNLARLLERKGDYAGALPLVERTLEARERVLGPEHPSTLVSLNNLAQLLEGKGDYAGALLLVERALGISERVLGPEHPSTLGTVNNLAILLQRKGDCAGAQRLYERALETSDRVLGREHPSTRVTLNNLAQLLENKGDYAGAQPLYERALEAGEQSIGSDHPDIAICLNNLAQLLQATNRLAEAEPLMRRALAIFEASLGESHPNVATQLNNLAQLLKATNRLAEAEPLMRRMVEIILNHTQRTGHEHPNLRAALGNYGRLLEAMGRRSAEVRRTLEELCGRFEVDLGGTTPSEPSPKLMAVLEEIQLDPSKIQEIAGRLQREDPGLFMELVQFIQSQHGGGE